MDPKQKKEESLKHDRRNAYGENDKSSRNAIRRRKQWVNQTYRRAVKQALASPDPDDAEDRASLVQRSHWKKVPDQALGDALRNDLIREVEGIARKGAADSALFLRLEHRLTEDGWAPQGVRALLRQLRAVPIQPWPSGVDLGLTELRGLLTILRELNSEHGAETDEK